MEKNNLTKLDNYGFSVGVRKWKKEFNPKHFIVQTTNYIFNRKYFSFAHTPIVVDLVNEQSKFSRPHNFNVVNCPIKFPGNNEYRIPSELKQFDEAIAKAVAFEHNINKNIDAFYAYLSVKQEKIPSSDRYFPDNFSEIYWKENNYISRTYMVYDCGAPEFFPQSFNTDYPPTSNQIDTNLITTYDNYSLLALNDFSVHRDPVLEKIVDRTLFTLNFSSRVIGRSYRNTNSLFGEND